MVVRMSSEDVQFAEVDPASPAAVAAVQHYFAELGRRFETGFDPVAYATSSLAADRDQRFLLATRDGTTVGCGALRPLDDGVAEIKRMWVDPTVRGLGLGRRLLVQLEELAVNAGCHLIRLDTNGSLTEAIGLYERHGYRRIPRYNDNPYAQVWFEKVLD